MSGRRRVHHKVHGLARPLGALGPFEPHGTCAPSRTTSTRPATRLSAGAPAAPIQNRGRHSRKARRACRETRRRGRLSRRRPGERGEGGGLGRGRSQERGRSQVLPASPRPASARRRSRVNLRTRPDFRLSAFFAPLAWDVCPPAPPSARRARALSCASGLGRLPTGPSSAEGGREPLLATPVRVVRPPASFSRSRASRAGARAALSRWRAGLPAPPRGDGRAAFLAPLAWGACPPAPPPRRGARAPSCASGEGRSPAGRFFAFSREPRPRPFLRPRLGALAHRPLLHGGRARAPSCASGEGRSPAGRFFAFSREPRRRAGRAGALARGPPGPSSAEARRAAFLPPPAWSVCPPAGFSQSRRRG
jgi:hypothetical protein